MIPFGEWLPDMADLNNPGATVAKNVLPHPQGYIPLPSETVYSAALTGYCRGGILARDKDNNVYLFAGDDTKIQKLANDTTWTDVTRSGDAYNTGDTIQGGERWEFMLWNQTVVATNFSDEIQTMAMGGANFADLGGTPPQARTMTSARNFMLVGNVNEVSGDGLVPNRVQWSALNDNTTWAATSTNQADEEDLKGDGGWVQRLIGGEYVIIFQERSIWRMTYVGAPVVWQLDNLSNITGLLAPGLCVRSQDAIYFLSPNGFLALRGGTNLESIGYAKVDRYVLDDINTAALHRCCAVADDSAHRIYFAYPGNGSTEANKMVIYDYALERWSYSEQNTQALLVAATAGYTLDGLDNVNASIDALTLSLDDPAWTGGRGSLAKFNGDNKLAFLSGTPMSATIETPEVQVTENRRTLINAVRPVVDGGTTTIQVGTRQVQSGTESWSSAATVNGRGRATLRRNARYHRVRANITGTWTHAEGVELEGQPAGWR